MEYWRIFNKKTENKKGKEKLGTDINAFYRYFRDLSRSFEKSDEINIT